MRDAELRSITLADLSGTGSIGDALLDLNNAHATELSWLEPDQLRHLVSEAFAAQRLGDIDAFMLAFDQSADYASPNFLWFRSRYARFVYVDRIVVAPSARGRGYARCLYHDLFAQAVRVGHDRIVCEVNSYPPNPASDAFHAAFGFVEVGTANIQGAHKTVRYLSHLLPRTTATCTTAT